MIQHNSVLNLTNEPMEVLMKHLNTTIFLFKDASYNYLLSGNKLILSPLGHRKVREYTLSDAEVSQIIDYYVTPMQELRNIHPYIVDFIDDLLDFEDDLIAYVDTLVK